jgi:hypothetical protein
MRLHLIGQSSDTLLSDFESGGIHFERIDRPIGEVYNGGDIVEILSYSIPAVAAIAVAWLNTRPTRKLMITLKDKTTIHAEGKSISEVKALLESAQLIIAADTEKSKSKTK